MNKTTRDGALRRARLLDAIRAEGPVVPRKRVYALSEVSPQHTRRHLAMLDEIGLVMVRYNDVVVL